MSRCNDKIRSYASDNKVFLYRIADKMNISYDTLIRRLRYELDESEQKKIISIIDELSEKKGE